MGKRSWRSRLMLLLLAMSLVLVAGCQAVGGVDFNKVLKNALKVQSGESKQTLELKLELNDEMLEDIPEEELAVVRMLSHVKLELSEVKIQDAENMSMEGRVSFGDDTGLSFAFQLSPEKLVADLEGAKHPFVVDLASMALADEEWMYEGEEEMESIDTEALTPVVMEMIDMVGNYAIDNLPNPRNLKVSPVYEQVNGVGTSLMHVQMEMNGPELWDWAKGYVDALYSDREGLEAMMKGVIELMNDNTELWPLYNEMLQPEKGVLDAPTVDEEISDAADGIMEMLESLQEEMRTAEVDDSFDIVVSDALNMKVDMYVDNKLNIRKSGFELSYELNEELGDDQLEEQILPLKRITLKSDMEQWNVNGSVEADKPVVTEDTIDVQELDSMQGYETIRLFEEDSFLYDLLKNKLHITRQTYTAYNDDYYNPPIIVPGYITIVPLRDVADTFGSEIAYDPETRSIELYDEATDTTIVMAIGSDQVTVNGEAAVWPFPVTSIDSTAYVPARVFVEALGATIEWETLYEDFKMLTIQRDL
ncbi:copper amine oxidase N-terminal domain-containing protein [Paenibacillus sp. J5C_2022]|uniref:copper amine oxidase N-terminal domain-containing protein n=1 Tax=Paenibacillus sp. J5C2022 TaxID=2977129 RepID=UPI0021CF049E|nr:copper amine oxidase N-terminal domain-containing protein [Paenibacillus sp. J5C2022]MCU6709272.1 copper amine oxidase N-terminal domain-containing protein [Paenibacillus sp. J5C2022]